MSKIGPSDADIRDAEEQFFGFLGRYVAFFQWIESEVDEIIRLGCGFRNRQATNDRLARMTNYEKVDHLKELMANSTYFSRLRALQGWPERTDKLVSYLHEERDRRNALLHSTYLFDFMKVGMPVMRANRRRQNGQTVLDAEDLSSKNMDGELRRLAEFCFQIGQYKVQVVALITDPDG